MTRISTPPFAAYPSPSSAGHKVSSTDFLPKGFDPARIVPRGPGRFAWVDDNGVAHPLRTGDELPNSDGVPVETTWHGYAMRKMQENIMYWWRDRSDFFVSCDNFIHFSPNEVFNEHFRGPDVYVVTNVAWEPLRKSWVMWEEGGRLPDLIIEMVSESSVRNDIIVKKELYQSIFKTQEYYCIFPGGNRIEAWRLNRQKKYQPIKPVDGRYPSEILGASIGWWTGDVWKSDQPAIMTLPRLYDPAGRLVPYPVEAERQRADAQHQRADAEHQRADAAESELARVLAELERLKRAKSD